MVKLRGYLKRRIRPSFEERQTSTAKRLQKLRKRRIQAEGSARLSKLEQKELARIQRARAATKSRSSGLVKFGKKVMKDPETKRFLKKLDKEIFGGRSMPKKRRKKRKRR